MAVGTPDYQYGVVSSQALIGTLAAGVGTDTVNVPPNAESLIVVTPGTTSGIFVTVIGATSGLSYPGAKMTSAVSGANSSTFAFDASSALDEEVTVSIQPVPGAPSYVYADAGVHQVVDLSKLGDARGVQFVGPVIPGITSNAHPPNEITVTSANLTTNGTLVAAPGAGRRIRLFCVHFCVFGAGMQAQLVDSVSGTWLGACSQYAGGALPLPPQGVPLSANAALSLTVQGSGSSVNATAYYTYETI